MTSSESHPEGYLLVDHLKGLNPSWNYGKIYASMISKKLICNRYPNLEKLVVSSLY